MVDRTFSNINQEIGIKNNIKIYKSKNISSCIYNNINKINLSKISILERKNKPLFFRKIMHKKELHFFKIRQENQKAKNDIKENNVKKQHNDRNNNNKIIRNYIMSNLIIKFIIINIFCQIKSNIIFDLFNFHYSSKITLKIKGIGEKNIWKY